MHNKIRDLPEDERPYEKYLKYGVKSLTDAELLAVIIKTGTSNLSSIDISRKILKNPDNSIDLLNICKKSYEDLMDIPGIGEVKALTIKCIAEIIERISISKYTKSSQISAPKDVADYFMEKMRHLDYEELRVLFLNSNNTIITEKTITKGTVDFTIVSPREIFIQALKVNAVKIVLIHNHPSGNLIPSDADCDVTEKIVNAGELLNIKVIDHIIIGDNNYMSFKEIGLI